ncbi:L-2-hydroxyglutarate oxidase [Gallaecimonas xiamenensis]|uniref:Hydroxyglutarate oxidase n=1 Tax=Gallaecimonas xiamenensis 3-C-1 TaxID=745411 RepID=K2K2J0_9GAMM|nr:L-2-hydroxyglutarate oxidase [Gallaecimonas xiamenensis]EKE71675.1 hydroxyglutarate oxidase [Gallaecimonas xiamenensis 3-C-1]
MYDFIIIGAGIVGMSTAMQLLERFPGKKVVVLEKEASVACHQTGHNSGVIHAGVYYTPGSLKARFCLEGNRDTKRFCDENAIAYQSCGKLLVATNELEMTRMQALWQRTEANGLERYWLSGAELKEREPNIVGLGGIFVPSSGIVSYRQVTQAMAKRFTEAGGEIRFNTQVTGLKESAQDIRVETGSGDLAGRYLLSCSGLMADRVVRMLGLQPDFRICPFRGEYYLLPPKHNQIVNHLIYPIPDPNMPFLGVHLTRMIDGTVTVGPNAVLAFKREGYRKTDFSLADSLATLGYGGIRKVLRDNLKPGLKELRNSLFKGGYLKEVQKYCPSVGKDDLLPYPAGVRAQAVSKDGKLVDDFLFVRTPRTINVCNAPSPAATSALPIGRHIIQEAISQFQLA